MDASCDQILADPALAGDQDLGWTLGSALGHREQFGHGAAGDDEGRICVHAHIRLQAGDRNVASRNLLNMNNLDKLAEARMTRGGHLTTSDDDGAASPQARRSVRARRRVAQAFFSLLSECVISSRCGFFLPILRHGGQRRRIGLCVRRPQSAEFVEPDATVVRCKKGHEAAIVTAPHAEQRQQRLVTASRLPQAAANELAEIVAGDVVRQKHRIDVLPE